MFYFFSFITATTFIYGIQMQFLVANFVVMLFHYDGIVDQWKDLEWSSSVIHISAINQTKWYCDWKSSRILSSLSLLLSLVIPYSSPYCDN